MPVTSRPPTCVLWNDLLGLLAQLNMSFQAFSQKLHQHCSEVDTTGTPDELWYQVLRTWDFDYLDALRLLPRIKAFENDYENAKKKYGLPPPEDPGPSCQEPQIYGRDCADPNCQEPQTRAKKAKKAKKA